MSTLYFSDDAEVVAQLPDVIPLPIKRLTVTIDAIQTKNDGMTF